MKDLLLYQNEPVDEGGLSVSGSHLPTSEIAAGLAHALGGSEPPDHPAAASGSGETSTSRDKAGVKILAAMQKSWSVTFYSLPTPCNRVSIPTRRLLCMSLAPLPVAVIMARGVR